MLKAFLSPSGRRSRLTFWRAAALVPVVSWLALLVIGIAANVVRALLDHTSAATNTTFFFAGIVVVIIAAVAFWAGLAIGIQRLHDRDASGWWILVALVPGLGSIWYLLWNGLVPGTAGSNRFGPDPRSRHAAAIAVFDDGPGPTGKPIRRPIASLILSWLMLLAILVATIFLFQAPKRNASGPTAVQPKPFGR